MSGRAGCKGKGEERERRNREGGGACCGPGALSIVSLLHVVSIAPQCLSHGAEIYACQCVLSSLTVERGPQRQLSDPHPQSSPRIIRKKLI
jgi:hypothetical protein